MASELTGEWMSEQQGAAASRGATGRIKIVREAYKARADDPSLFEGRTHDKRAEVKS